MRSVRAEFAGVLDELQQSGAALTAWKRVLEVQPGSGPRALSRGAAAAGIGRCRCVGESCGGRPGCGTEVCGIVHGARGCSGEAGAHVRRAGCAGTRRGGGAGCGIARAAGDGRGYVRWSGGGELCATGGGARELLRRNDWQLWSVDLRYPCATRISSKRSLSRSC